MLAQGAPPPSNQWRATPRLHGMGQTLARIENGVFTYLHPDHLGSPQAGTKGQGNPVAQYGDVAWNEHFTPFGEALISNAANDNQGGFTGHIKDKATGLNYMQARYYDPNIGRFLSVDPVTFMHTGSPGMFNRYSYTYNNPVNMIDPHGLIGFSITGDCGDATVCWEDGSEGSELGDGGVIERRKGKKSIGRIPHNNQMFSDIMERKFGVDSLSLGNNELKHARDKHNEKNSKLKPHEGIFLPEVADNNLDLAVYIGILINTSLAYEDPTFVTSEGSKSIGVNFIGPSTGYGSALEHKLGIPTPITRIVIGNDKDGTGGRLTTIYPLSPQKALAFSPPPQTIK